MNFNEPTPGNAEQAAVLEHFRELDKFAWRMELLPRDDSMVEHLFTEERGEILPAFNAAKLPAQEPEPETKAELNKSESEQETADVEAGSTSEAEPEAEQTPASVTAEDDVVSEPVEITEAAGIESVVANKGRDVEEKRFYSVLSEMADRLEQHVSWVMSAMNRWCLTVLGWEIVLLALAAGLVVGIAALLGDGQPLPILQDWWQTLLARPVSFAVYVILLLLVGFIIHFRLRRHVAASIAARLDMVHPFDTQRAFLKNTRIWRSIFRPWPKGWASRAERKLKEVRRELAEHTEPASTE